jgi:hypothetical protein
MQHAFEMPGLEIGESNDCCPWVIQPQDNSGANDEMIK